jgi:hypothetical protein
MSGPARLPVRAALTGALTALVVATAALVAVDDGEDAAAVPLAPVSAPVAAKKKSTNPVTPGDFTGYGFDQCLAPTQAAMDTWLEHSPFLAVGIYISGTSRACRNQPNLTPTWISTQLAKGWRLLPITLGPQASCQPRFPRYSDDVKIDPKPGGNNRYPNANAQGIAEANTTVADAQALGLVPGSTLWYDLEGYDSTNKHCRESALRFLSGWTQRLHELGYVSGVYSSAGSGIKDLDNARVSRPDAFILPDRIWVARWDGVANTSSPGYLREDGWRPGGRVKQYRGGHDETWGGQRINIDSNFLEVGARPTAPAESRCGGVRVSFPTYGALRPTKAGGKKANKTRVKALKCLLQENGHTVGKLNGVYTPKTVAAVRAWQARVGHPQSNAWTRKNWLSLLSAGTPTTVKYGSTGDAVRRLQRSLNALNPKSRIPVDGVFSAKTERAVTAYQKKLRQGSSGVANAPVWTALAAGKRQR